jgi:hypothetical protein
MDSTPVGYLERAQGALELAGRALDPNAAADSPDFALGADLLCKALENAVRALDPARESRGSLPEAVGCLDDELLTGAAGNRARAVALTTDLVAAASGAVPVSSVVSSGERFVAALLDRARRAKPAQTRRKMVIMIALAALGIGGVAFAVAPPADDDLRFRASSSIAPYPTEGRLGDRGRYDIFIHTQQEKSPWVEIDLGRERAIQEVRVTNRADCCADRAVPMVISVRTEGGEYHEVARRKRGFDRWDARFASEKARFVRLSVPRETTLHLQEIRFR